MHKDGKKSVVGEQVVKPYKKDAEYSYTLGAFPTFELLKARPEQVRKVVIDPSFTDQEKLISLCKELMITYEHNQKLISKISDKENCYVAAIFDKYTCELGSERPHIVLVNPSNMGNLGTILRTAVGFGIYDIAIILPGADIFHPKTVRSSMGALFKLRFHQYQSFQEYRNEFQKHQIFTFMLNGENTLTIQECPKVQLFSLVFGNEATGLDDSYLEVGTSILIPQSPDVDSLNLTIAVGIGAYVFTNQNKK
ncbi:TrmH family RNA methyltransferase [Lachnospiraceae bacterium MD1]|uniref:TrmH family RNA methyltransferase n=1 Tax=Variimorphobacter saccharofermentans TaxID=2755051 RepID=A0A839JZ41_9FIRM|nr:TrmH family RNA methyltransferase [Variimorphobacter saccharofermentans]MBB2182634.1 TrmH family RNA methyltransferase [Variimorphobacter saccharofermentans]